MRFLGRRIMVRLKSSKSSFEEREERSLSERVSSSCEAGSVSCEMSRGSESRSSCAFQSSVTSMLALGVVAELGLRTFSLSKMESASLEGLERSGLSTCVSDKIEEVLFGGRPRFPWRGGLRTFAETMGLRAEGTR